MATISSVSKNVTVLRWVARILGTILVLFVLSQFIGAFIRKGNINVGHPGHYVMFASFGLAQVGILMAWRIRWEAIGGFLTIFGIITTILLDIFWVQGSKMPQSIIAFLFWLIPGFLFIYCRWKNRGASLPADP